MIVRTFTVVMAALAIAGAGASLVGCSSSPQGPTPAQAAAANAKLKQDQQQGIQAVQNDPNMSDDQKAAAISKLNRDETGPKFGRGAR